VKISRTWTGFWQEHKKIVKDFDYFADAILEGAETEEGTIHASTDPELRNVVTQADSFHNDQFQRKHQVNPACLISKILDVSTNTCT